MNDSQYGDHDHQALKGDPKCYEQLTKAELGTPHDYLGAHPATIGGLEGGRRA